MAARMRGSWVVAVLAALVLAVLIYAWADGGREPLRDISTTVAVPGAAQ